MHKLYPKRVYNLARVQSLDVLAREGLRFVGRRFFHLELGNEIVPYLRRIARMAHCRTYIDIGAWKGDTLLPVANTFEICIGIEALRDNVYYINKKLRELNLSNCVVLQSVLGEEVRNSDFYVSDIGEGQSALKFMPNRRMNHRLKVKVNTLDSLLERFSRVLPVPIMVKVDVNGYENGVLHGAIRTLARTSVVFSEFWPYGASKFGTNLMEYVKFMTERDFIACNLMGRQIPSDALAGVCDFGKNDKGFVTDIVFLRKGTNTS